MREENTDERMDRQTDVKVETFIKITHLIGHLITNFVEILLGMFQFPAWLDRQQKCIPFFAPSYVHKSVRNTKYEIGNSLDKTLHYYVKYVLMLVRFLHPLFDTIMANI